MRSTIWRSSRPPEKSPVDDTLPCQIHSLGDTVMIRKHTVFLSLLMLACLSMAQYGRTEEVEVVVDSASLRVEAAEVAEVKRGDRLQVVQRSHPWIYVKSNQAGKVLKGWLLCTEVQTVVEAGIDDNSPAPPAFGGVRASVNGTTYFLGAPRALYVNLSLLNDGLEALSYNANQIELHVGGRPVRAWPPTSPIEIMGYGSIRMIDENGELRRCSSQEIARSRLGGGSLAPGEKTSGWLVFPLQFPVAGPSASAGPSWEILIPLGEDRLQVDLLEAELTAAALKIRPSKPDPSVSVLEIGSRINMVNSAKVAEIIESLAAREKGFLIVFSSPLCTVDPHARYVLSGGAVFSGALARIAAADARVAIVGPGPEHRDLLSAMGPLRANVVPSEEAGVAFVLAGRSGGEGSLVKNLASESAEVRANAASSLAAHLGQDDVFKGLVAAVGDKDASVRLAALRSFGAGLGGFPTGWPAPLGPQLARVRLKAPIKLEGELLEAVLRASDDPQATVRAAAIGLLYYGNDPRGEKPILAALNSPDGMVQSNAVRAAVRYPTKAVVAALVQQLGKTPPNPRDSNAAIALCRTLGKMKAVETVPQLTQLKDKSSDYIAAAAIDALREIGSLSATGAALEKLEKRCLTPEDRKMLVESQDQEVLSRLNQIVPGQFDKRVVEEAICIRADRGDKTALQSLFDTLSLADEYSETVPLSVGRAGDPRGIEPLKKALGRYTFSSRRPQIKAALFMLDAPEIRKQITDDFRAGRLDFEAQKVVESLLQCMGGKAMPFIAPLLDAPACVMIVTPILWETRAPEAVELLRAKLSDPLYRNSGIAVSALVRTLTPLATDDEIGRKAEEIKSVVMFLDSLRETHNSETRRAVAAELGTIEKTLGAEKLAQLLAKPGG